MENKYKILIALVLIGVVLSCCAVSALFIGSLDSTPPKPAMTLDQIKSQATPVNMATEYRDILRNPAGYTSKIIRFKGEIYQSEKTSSGYTYFVETQSYDVNPVAVSYGTRFVDGDKVLIWGKVTGIGTYTNVLGVEREVPEVDALHMELANYANSEETESAMFWAATSPFAITAMTLASSGSTLTLANRLGEKILGVGIAADALEVGEGAMQQIEDGVELARLHAARRVEIDGDELLADFGIAQGV